MLKTNSKKAIENIRNYIIENFTPDNYTNKAPEGFPEIARFILDVFEIEKYYTDAVARRRGLSDGGVFAEWCAGLPAVLDTLYYYNRSAVDDLGALLEESESEKSKYSESQAEQMLTRLIYRELLKGAKK